MRILLISQWFPPEPAKIQFELAQSLQALGNNVTVLTGIPNYPAGKVYPGYKTRLLQKEEIDGIRVLRVPLFPDHSRSAIRRVLNHLTFVLAATLVGPWVTPKVDVVYAMHHPLITGVPGWLISRLKRVPLVCEVQDMWPEALQSVGMIKNKALLKGIGGLAKWLYGRGQAIRVISPGFRENLIDKGVRPDRIHVLSNWADVSHYRPMNMDPVLAKEHGLADRFNVMYAGSIGLPQALDVVLDAAEILRDLPDVQFVLIGDGPDLERLRAAAVGRQIENVKFLGRHPSERMPDFFALADVLLLHLRDDPVFRITIPHKVFTYMAAAKPVLAAVAGDATDVIESANAGVTCPPDNPRTLADVVRQLHAMPDAKRQEIGMNGRCAVCEFYSQDRLVKQIFDMIDATVRSG